MADRNNNLQNNQNRNRYLDFNSLVKSFNTMIQKLGGNHL